MPANLEISAVATGLEKVSFYSNPKEKQCQKCSNNCTIVLISHASITLLACEMRTIVQLFEHFWHCFSLGLE